MQRHQVSCYRQKWAELVSIFGERCAYCHINWATVLDHVIPVSYIEYHGIENLRPCCQWCNMLVFDKVFEDFEAKYEWLRDARNAKKIRGEKPLTCTDCLLPYYSALGGNFRYCPKCYAIEYQMPVPSAWYVWERILEKAGFITSAHYKVAELSSSIKGMPLKDKVEFLVAFYQDYMDQEQADQLLHGVY